MDIDRYRLLVKVAWMYHSAGVTQKEIAYRLGVSQSQVSRLLETAVKVGVVRTTVVVPDGIHAELETQLEDIYGLREAHVFDVVDGADDRALVRELGQLLAGRLDASPLDAKVIGLTSWSRSLRETVRAVQRPTQSDADYVVEMLGDVGPPQVQHEAAQVTQRLATLVGATPLFLRVPGVTQSSAARDLLLAHDRNASETIELFDHLDVALVGIGTCEVVPPLHPGENFFTQDQFKRARALGAVGQVNLRFVAADGSPVQSELDDLVVGITLEQLSRTARTIAVAGGPSKYLAIRAALLGRWVNILATDVLTAQFLIAEHDTTF